MGAFPDPEGEPGCRRRNAGPIAVVRLLSEAPLFWNTALGVLQVSALAALERVFDPDPNNHGIRRLLALAHAKLGIFSKDALATRNRKLSANADEFMRDCTSDSGTSSPIAAMRPVRDGEAPCIR